MAVVTVTILEGRDRATLERVHAGIASVLIRELNAKPHQVRTVIHEISPRSYAVGGVALPDDALSLEKKPAVPSP
jgi:phenylpyruvate tautomerase PptA (4-oxalocrotonate tautomerase family)